MKVWQKVLLVMLIPVSAIALVWVGMAFAAPELPASLAPVVDRAKTQDRKVVLLLTGSAWCAACQALEKNTLSTPEWRTFAAEGIVWEVFDYPADGAAPSPAHGDLRRLPNFRGYPTLVVADQGGRLLALRDGSNVTAGELIAWIRSL